jgi:hypothetical protein
VIEQVSSSDVPHFQGEYPSLRLRAQAELAFLGDHPLDGYCSRRA